MAIANITKHIRMGQQFPVIPREPKPVEEKVLVVKNKKSKKDNAMTDEQLRKAMEMADELNPQVKVLKKDRGLIERTESSKIILTEDNRQVLND